MPTNAEITNATVEIVRREGDLLVTAWPGRMGLLFPSLEVNGNVTWGDEATNVVFLMGISERMAEAWRCVCRDERLDRALASIMCFYVDGAPIYGLPIGKRLPKGGYKEPHWVPTRLVLRRVAG